MRSRKSIVLVVCLVLFSAGLSSVSVFASASASASASMASSQSSVQGLPSSLAAQLSQYLTQADFTYSASQDDMTLSGEGKLYIQDSCYVLDLNIMKIYSDGLRRWTVDEDAKEVYIEKVESGLQNVIAGYEIVKFEEENGRVKAQVRSQNGSMLNLTIPKMQMAEKVSIDFFRFNTATLGGGWVITDLEE